MVICTGQLCCDDFERFQLVVSDNGAVQGSDSKLEEGEVCFSSWTGAHFASRSDKANSLTLNRTFKCVVWF